MISKKTATNQTASSSATRTKRKLSNKERAALQNLPDLITQLEAEYTQLSEKMASPDYYQDNNNDAAGDVIRLEQLEADTMAAYEQWETLEKIVNGEE